MQNKPILIHEVRDMWPETLVVGYGMKRYNPFVWLLQRAENSAYHKSDFVVSTLEFAKEHMIKHGLKEEKYNYLTNGVTLADWENPQELPEIHRQLLQGIKSRGKFIVGYFGGMTPLDTLDFFLDAVRNVSRKEIQFVMVGDGRDKERLEKRIQDENITNCMMLPRIEKKAVPNLLKLFDCIYMGTEYTELNKYGVSLTKMTDAMISGVPIIFRTNVENLVSQNSAGIVVDTKDPKVLADKFVEVFEMDDDKRKQMGKNGHDAVVNNFTYEKLARKYAELFPAKKDLHILMIQHYAGSNKMGMVFRPYYLAREWVKMGFKVDMFVASYSHLRVENPNIEESFQKEEIDGIMYHWVKTRKYTGNGVKRAFSIFDFVGQTLLHASKISKELQPDVIITGSTYMLDNFVGQRIRRKSRKLLNNTEKEKK